MSPIGQSPDRNWAHVIREQLGDSLQRDTCTQSHSPQSQEEILGHSLNLLNLLFPSPSAVFTFLIVSLFSFFQSSSTLILPTPPPCPLHLPTLHLSSVQLPAFWLSQLCLFLWTVIFTLSTLSFLSISFSLCSLFLTLWLPSHSPSHSGKPWPSIVGLSDPEVMSSPGRCLGSLAQGSLSWLIFIPHPTGRH